MSASLSRRLAAEAVGTALLLAAIVGSGIMAERSGGNAGQTLLANTIATGAALVALILTFISVSGAHFNPAVTLSFAFSKKLTWTEALSYVSVQVAGGVLGTVVANLMFSLPVISLARHERSGMALVFSECVATFGLILVIHGCAAFQPRLVAFAVASFITAGYWFTSSTSFANPAVTLARSLSDTFTGIRLNDVPWFVLAQFVGGIAATVLAQWLFRTETEESP